MSKSISEFKGRLIQILKNFPGWNTKRKIIVIESDDWGSIRMPSREVFNNFLENGFRLSDSEYNRLDSLESEDDLISLYETLTNFKDLNGNFPVLTANIVVGNPDFHKIRHNDFMSYFYEPVAETFKQYKGCENVEELWKQGNDWWIFHPQFHGREHVNVARWMSALRAKTPEIMFTFDHRTTFSGEGDYNYMEVLDYDSVDDLANMNNSLIEGLNLFENIFGYRSKSFIPPCYTWSSDIEETLHKSGVKYIQGINAQLIPTGFFGKYKKKYHFLGRRNSFDQYFLIRNCFFEPALSIASDPVGECLRSVGLSFTMHKPAVICSHRINYMGSLDEKNRINNLRLLRDLLHTIIIKWPEVEFMTSDQLGDLIAEERN